MDDNPLNPTNMVLADGTTVADWIKALCDALKSKGHQGIILMTNAKTGECHVAGHIPDGLKLKEILEDMLRMVNEQLEKGTGVKSLEPPVQ